MTVLLRYPLHAAAGFAGDLPPGALALFARPASLVPSSGPSRPGGRRVTVRADPSPRHRTARSAASVSIERRPRLAPRIDDPVAPRARRGARPPRLRAGAAARQRRAGRVVRRRLVGHRRPHRLPAPRAPQPATDARSARTASTGVAAARSSTRSRACAAPTRRATPATSRAHYDLGNEFFRRLLDETMTYSCAIFDIADHDRSPTRRGRSSTASPGWLELAPGDRVLEIGTGWGGFALHAAEHYGCHVTTTTISQAPVRVRARPRAPRRSRRPRHRARRRLPRPARHRSTRSSRSR